jgi:uncharacterized protein YndB with AHSA1/START domain
MTETQTIPASVTRLFDAPAEHVFDAWLDPETARAWLFTVPSGEIVRAEIDPRIGGQFVMTDRRGAVDVEHIGAYLELDRPRRLAFTYKAGGGESSLATVDIAPRTRGCEVTVTHHLTADWSHFVEPARGAWLMMLDGLARALA